MINRVLIRLKVVQIVYAYYKNSGKSLKAAEDEMFFSLSKAYDLYHYLLLLMPGITHYAADRISFLSRKVRPTESDKNPNLKFVNNRFVAQLGVIEQLVKFAEKSKLNWVDHSDFLRRTLDKIEASDIYKEYMESGVDSYEEDKEVWRKLYKAFVFENEELDDIIEEQSLYWNDDKAIVDTFVPVTCHQEWYSQNFTGGGRIYGRAHPEHIYQIPFPFIPDGSFSCRKQTLTSVLQHALKQFELTSVRRVVKVTHSNDSPIWLYPCRNLTQRITYRNQ